MRMRKEGGLRELRKRRGNRRRGNGGLIGCDDEFPSRLSFIQAFRD